MREVLGWLSTVRLIVLVIQPEIGLIYFRLEATGSGATGHVRNRL